MGTGNGIQTLKPEDSMDAYERRLKRIQWIDAATFPLRWLLAKILYQVCPDLMRAVANDVNGIVLKVVELAIGDVGLNATALEHYHAIDKRVIEMRITGNPCYKILVASKYLNGFEYCEYVWGNAYHQVLHPKEDNHA